ncbi:MAG TPA: maleylacetoacetate isomerase [Verrucomicrobiae bacterium]|nr:maleylacetoacetate isomerase [Verrucomicrobiae bacterium]
MLKLYSFWRSSASYRVRIALALKGLPYEYVPIHLVRDGGEQNAPAYRALNPQGRVPLLVDGDFRIAQSMAILDYLESLQPSPALRPTDARQRARVLAFCEAINADTQPLQNTGAVLYLGERLGADEAAKGAWMRHWIERGLTVLEQERAGAPETGYAFGESPTWADCLLVPQVYNAERWKCDLHKFPKLVALARRVREEPAFAAAHPSQQPDAAPA